MGNPLKKAGKAVSHAVRDVGRAAKSVYNTYTGHYSRQQERAVKSANAAASYEQQKYKEEALRIRKEQINLQRETLGVGTKKYRTSTRFYDETLG